ncbi:MAG: hypothetical protein WKF84_13830 [Pyrinomonadaceae bacterium]
MAEALRAEFRDYQAQILANAKALAAALQQNGFRIVSGGTDNHLMLVDVFNGGQGVTGKVAEKALEAAGITANKNTIPFDTNSPFVASGIRLGTPALTTRGMREKEMLTIAQLIGDVLHEPESDDVRRRVKRSVEELAARFPFMLPGSNTKQSERVKR